MGSGHSKPEAKLPGSADTYVNFDDSDPKWVMNADATATLRFAESGIASKERCPPMTMGKMIYKILNDPTKRDLPALQIERPLPPVDQPECLPQADWQKWTWAEFIRESECVAKAFVKLDVQMHDGINVFGFNSPEWHMTTLACWLSGTKIAGIYPTDTVDQVQYKAAHSNARVCVCEDKGKFDKYVAKINEMPKVKALVMYDQVPCPQKEVMRNDGSKVSVYTWSEFVAMGNDGVFPQSTAGSVSGSAEDSAVTISNSGSSGGSLADSALKERQAAIEPGHCCALIYTSGTTGNPKAVMISHDNIIYEAFAVVNSILKDAAAKPGMQERILSYLPMSHIAGLMIDVGAPVALSALRPGYMTVFFARPYDLKEQTIKHRLTFVRPTVFIGVPRVWEKFKEKMLAVGATIKGVKGKIRTWAKKKRLARSWGTQLGAGQGEAPCGSGLAHKILGVGRKAIGLNELKFGGTAAAPITMDTLTYFGSIGVQVNEIYGMSECTGAATVSDDNTHRWGSCGYGLPGVEVAIMSEDGKTRVKPCDDLFTATEAEQGEICFRGRNTMMGYMCNPDLGKEHVEEIKKKNAECIDANGWIHSGDKGAMDKNGMFKVTGRYKELIIGAGGENIAPVPIEDNIKLLCQGISNVMMVGDQKKFNTMLVTLKTVGASGEKPGGNELTGPAAKMNPAVTTVSAAMEDPEILKQIEDAIKATNNDPAICANNTFKVQKFKILPRDFSVETGEFTPTLKLKRAVVADMWSSIIDTMYEE